MPIGDAKIDNDAVVVEFSLPDTLREKDKIKFKFSAEKDAVFAPTYTFGIFDVDPLKSPSYNEIVLIHFENQKFKDLKKEDGSYGDYVIEYTFQDLTDLFPKTEEEEKIGYFVFHREDWSRREITKYSSFAYKYSYSGNAVKISSIYD